MSSAEMGRSSLRCALSRVPSDAMLLCRRTLTLLRRVFSTSCTQKSQQRPENRSLKCQYASQLTHRALVRMEGEDGRSFLQGFVTADMEDTQRGEGVALYSMLLNAQGRVLYDILIYPLLDGGSYFLECDSGISGDLVRHLRKYALRAKAKFSLVEDQVVWGLFPGQPTQPDSSVSNLWSPDPRFSQFGSRAILPTDIKAPDVWPDLKLTDIGAYHDHRLVSGIPEGTDDIIPGVSLPLECNLEYLNGVSFSKGCYLGQELTARTHHTGIIRKRIMPVTLDRNPSSPIQSGTAIVSSSGRSAGKLLEHRGSIGLALIRLNEITKGPMTIQDGDKNLITVTAHTPDYWPDRPSLDM